jgi:hypothetical protein
VVKYFFEAIDAQYMDDLLVRGVDEKGQIKDHPDQLAAAFEMGKKLASK